ncbi:ribosomal maturation YjgA family protein [Bordetella hinzii]|jgi:hypothetical protein|uniref:ribosomal maturation YjgA family protein n=1 Tax=Bordetella hinzii TaxID=103855 RepID=UPI00041D699E|nr:DUF2809 domain-containing protein [Bordetella hinzii]AKQ55788.1 hypothetical protein ACR54_02473 [Bordetella hinzii]KCB31503.1 PF10990 family protein [Bordetella hinzii L60]KCB45972.1 PF10990 family protein [Bordetella hinzii 4161]KCB52180.1 PF10990 family protein [Bordetella hinzii 1277]KXA72189.1 hypothetical protein AXA74_14635 [Bordetella hinzii LMG 13501]
MTICFNPRALAAALLLFIALAVLATAGAGWGWVRSFLGDTLAVIWVYYLFKIFLRAHVLALAGLAFGMGVFVELGQYAAAHLGWRLPNPVLRMVLGSTADGWDILAYALGWVAVVAIELPRPPRGTGGKTAGP